VSNGLVRSIVVILRYAWASPATVVGLALSAIALCAGARVRCIGGVIEVGGGPLRTLTSRLPSCASFAAITFGHIVIGVDHDVLREVREHERVHVQQYERWGLLFFPLYVGSSVIQLLAGGNPYRDNAFEREAYAACAERLSVVPRSG
jgi:hypothetical protein